MKNSMLKYIVAFAVGLWLSVGGAIAQTSPNLTYGQVLTPAQWNQLFINKQDTLGFTPVNSAGGIMTGRLVTAPPSSTTSGFNLGPGTTPATPANGDLWITSLGFFAQVNGVTVGPLAQTGGTNVFTGQQTTQGLTTTSPGWFAQITGDANARVRIGLNSTDIPSIALGPGSAVRDTFIERAAAATVRFGSPDAAAPVAQTLSVQNVLAGTSNAAGANLTIAGSRGTGTGAGGGILFQTAPLGSSGSAQNALATALTIFPSGGLATGAAADQGAGALNLAGSLYSNGTGPTGTGGYVRGTGPTITGPTITGTIAGSPAITSPTINSGAISGTFTGAATFSGALTLGSALTYGGVTLANSVSGTGSMVLGTSPTISGGTFSGAQTFSGAPSFTGLAAGTCTNGVAINSIGLAITVACPGAASSIQPGATTVTGGVVGDILAVGTGPTLIQVAPQVVTAYPTGTTQNSGSTQLMFGFGNVCHITPAFSGRIRFTLLGGMTSGSNVLRNLKYGSGGAPSSGATASISGLAFLWTTPITLAAAPAVIPVNYFGTITGLTIGTAYWFDESGAGSAAGNDIMSNPICFLEEF